MTTEQTPDAIRMSTEQADYLLGAVVGLAQGLRLIPLGDLADHLTRRVREARVRGTDAERQIAEAEQAAAEVAYSLVVHVERLMDTRRTAEQAAAAGAQQAEAAELPPSRRPLADDDVWVNVPPRPPR